MVDWVEIEKSRHKPKTIEEEEQGKADNDPFDTPQTVRPQQTASKQSEGEVVVMEMVGP